MDQTPVPPRVHRGIKLRDMFKEDEDPSSHDELHYEMTRNVEDQAPGAVGKQQHQMTQCKTAKEEQAIKYMSSIPNYLAKVKDFRGKPLNMGVLDWRRLEKWRWGNKLVPLKHGCSPASSSTSLFSTDESSPNSSGSHSNSPAWRRMNQQQVHSHEEAAGPASSQSHQRTGLTIIQHCQSKAYPLEFNSQIANNLGGASQKFQKQSIPICTDKEAQQSLSGTNQTFKREGHQSNSKLSSEVDRGRTRTRLEEPNTSVDDQDCSNRTNTVVLLLPKDHAETCSSVSRACGMLSGPREKMWSKEANHEQIHVSVSSDTSSCSVPPQLCNKVSVDSKGSCCSYGQDSKISSRSLEGMGNHAKILTRRSVIGSNVGEKPILSRNPSPARNFGHGMARIIKSASSRDHSPQRRPISRDISSRSVVERAAAALSFDNSFVDKSHVNSRARSSPLRRLLDPLLNPKGPHCVNPPQLVKKDPKSNEPVHVRDSEAAKVLSRLKSVCRIRTESSCQNLKLGSSRFQAILQVAVKNGLPLFTFAVNNSRDVLIATLKKSVVPGKDPSSWVYTFLTVSEIKRKNGIWSNQGPNRNDHGYVPNIIAQMRVSNQRSSYCSGLNCVEDADLREFALLGRDTVLTDFQGKEFVPTEELAAVIMKLPSKGTQDAASDEHTELSSTSAQDRRRLGSRIAFSAIMILPGAIHTIPSKGAVSTLTQRWKTGGSCDCGGWDLGCQLRVFSNCKKLEKQTIPNSISHVVDEFKLFSQVGEESDFPVLRMVPLKEQICSVEFDSSVSPLQTFAACIAILECSRPSEFFERSDISWETIPDMAIPEELIQTKGSNQSQHVLAPSPARYFSCPPLSPVGRA
ncbi:hypothetical protein Droror1_Dr00004269 [Drosera rotundifolia]